MITRQFHFKVLHNHTLGSGLREASSSSKHVHHLFDPIPRRDVLSVNRSMLDTLHKNLPFRALDIFKNHLRRGLSDEMDEVTLSLALKASIGDPKAGGQIHAFAITSGFAPNLPVSNALMNMYCKAGNFNKALCIFETLSGPDIVSWNTVLSGFEKSEDALSFVLRMNWNGVAFDAFTYTTCLAFCLDREGFLFGSQLHSLIPKSGLDRDVFVGNALITMYSRGERMTEARRVFDEMVSRDIVTWNAMLSGYAQEGNHGPEAIQIFLQMVKTGMKLDHVSFTSAVSACGHEKSLELGKQVHGLCIKRGYGSHVSVGNVLISTYSKCEAARDAKLIFEKMGEGNVVSWTTMISINGERAVSLFNEMRLNGVYPNDVTFIGLIHTITVQTLIQEGKSIHGCCIKTGFMSEVNVCNSLITMYAKFKFMQDSVKVFEEQNHRETISWNALISGYAQNGLYQSSLQTFCAAILETKPNQFTFGSVLNAIAAAEDISLKQGQRFHAHILKLGFSSCPVTLSALLDMYAKRGSIRESEKVFDEMRERGQFAWTAMISAHARHGDYKLVMDLFQEMTAAGVEPDTITFLSVLTACCRQGMVETGLHVFNSMIDEYNIEPAAEHYSCMVDMLGRAGRLSEAEELMGRVPGGPRLSMMQSLLGSCKIHGDVEIGERVSEALLKMEPGGSGSYVLMSNLYAEKGRWDKVADMWRGMRDRGVRKEVGFSWVDAIGNGDSGLSLHGFSSGDTSHPLSEDINLMAVCLASEMKHLRERSQTESCF